MTQALDGIRVIELGEGVSAAYCARLFADFGADVVKIADPHGDVARAWGPFPGDTPDPEKSGLFVFLNTNKRGIALDLASQDGRAALQRLLAGADLLVENLPLERARELGLDGDALQRAHPELVHVALSPFGRSGPYAGWKGYDLNAYHLTAAGHRYCGRPGEAPLEHGTFSAEFFGAAAAAAWGLAAVLGRARVGGGQQLDVSCAEAIAAVFVGGQNIGALAQDGKWEHRTGVGMPLGAPATILPCRDGHVWMLALEAGQWNGLRRVMGDPDWAQAEMFQDMFARAQNADLIYPLLEEWTLQHGKWEIMERCQAEGVPVTAVFSVQEAAEQPHLRARRHFVDIEHPKLGRVRHLGAPFRLPASPGGPARPAPGLGQHTREVLAQPPAAKRSAAPPPPAPSARALPLEGLRVANFGWVWAGPVVGQTLGFLGADVVKIESRTRIDLTRTLPPFGGGIRDPDRSLSNHACWAGNGSVTLDLKQPEAQALARRLIAQCDVVIENFGPGVMEQFQLGWDELRAVRPDLVMFSMPAAGLDGPLKDIRTYGLSLTSTTGLDSLTGYVDGPPIPVENAFSDPYNGILGAYAILVALAHRNRTGAGQHIDYSQQEAVMQMIGPAYMDYVLNGRVAGPLGNRHPLAAGAPHGVFPCAGDDRWISIAVLQDEEWRGLVRAMGDPEWARANDLATAAARVRRSDDIHERLAAWTREQDAGALTARLQQHGVAAASVLSVADLLSDPHWRARKTFVEVIHPLGFSETIYGAYVKMSRSQVDVQPGPRMGQDNERVLRDLLGLGADEDRRLLDAKIIH